MKKEEEKNELTIVIREKSKFDLFHGVKNVQHFLEALLKVKRKFQATSSSAQQFQQVAPQPQHVLFTGIYPESIQSHVSTVIKKKKKSKSTNLVYLQTKYLFWFPKATVCFLEFR